MAALPVAPCPSAGRRYRHRRAPGVVCAPDGGGVARSVRGSAVGWSRRRGPEAGLAAESFVPGRAERPSAWRAGCPQVGVQCWSFGGVWAEPCPGAVPLPAGGCAAGTGGAGLA